MQALDILGLGAGARDLGHSQARGALLRPDGSRIATIDVAAMRRKTGYPVYLLSRPALLALLASAWLRGRSASGRLSPMSGTCPIMMC